MVGSVGPVVHTIAGNKGPGACCEELAGIQPCPVMSRPRWPRSLRDRSEWCVELPDLIGKCSMGDVGVEGPGVVRDLDEAVGVGGAGVSCKSLTDFVSET